MNYSRPEGLLGLCPEFGGEETLRAAAADLKGATDEETVTRIHAWVARHLRYDASAFDHWRDLPTMLRDGTYGGCADYAVAFGSLARACGIPCVWVKTMDADWIRDFVAGRPEYRSYRGHVFLEVFVDGKWKLLEPGEPRLHDDYSTAARVLPGARWAYDKGGDPYALLLSVRWTEWLVQTERHFRAFDVSVLPVNAGRSFAHAPLDVLIVANAPVWEWLDHRCRALGFTAVYSVNADFDTHLPRVKGRRLVIVCVGDDLVLPAAYRARYLPLPDDEFAAMRAKTPTGSYGHTLPDGTHAIVIYAPDLGTMRQLVERLEMR